MVALVASEVVALDAGSFACLMALEATKLVAPLAQLTFNLVPVLICEVDVWVPVHADDVGPHLVLLINAFHEAFDLIAEEALDLSARHLPVLHQETASLAVPVAIRYALEELASIALLMSSCIAEIAHDDAIVLFELVLKANVALDVLILNVLVDHDLGVRVCRINLTTLLVNFHLLNLVCRFLGCNDSLLVKALLSKLRDVVALDGTLPTTWPLDPLHGLSWLWSLGSGLLARDRNCALQRVDWRWRRSGLWKRKWVRIVELLDELLLIVLLRLLMILSERVEDLLLGCLLKEILLSCLIQRACIF